MSNGDLDNLAQRIEQLRQRTPAQSELYAIQELVHELNIRHVELITKNLELERARADLLRSRNLYHALYDFAPVAYLSVDRDGIITHLNLRACNEFGADRLSLLGRPIHTLVAASSGEEWELHFSELGVDHDRASTEVLMLRADGSTFYAQLESVVSPRSYEDEIEIHIAIVDLTDRKETEDLFRVLLESASDGVLLMDHDGEILTINQQAERLFGYTKEQLSGEDVGLLIPSRLRERMRQAIAHTLTSTHKRHAIEGTEISLLQSTGHEIPVSISFTAFSSRGRMLLAAAISDLSDQKRKEEELRRAKEEAEKANLAKTDFLTNMSHEIRTPVAAILGYTEMLITRGDQSNEVRDAHLKTIKNNAHHLIGLIDDVLDIRRVETGEVKVEKEPVSLNHELRATLSMFENRAKAKGIALSCRLADDVPETIMTDALRLRQIVANLVSNGLKFTASGSVAIEAKLGDWDGADRRCHNSAKRLEVRVIDTGCGVDPAKVHDIFEPFQQADSSRTRKYGGTGLGLSLAKNFATRLGGDVVLEQSEVGRGSVFCAYIDPGLADAEARETRLVGATANPGEAVAVPVVGAELAGVKILLADDAVDLQMLFQAILMRVGAKVDVVDNGREAVDVALKGDYDLLLMDIQMPVLDGYGATQELRARGFIKPILALSAHALVGEKNKSIEAGCDDHITKPAGSQFLIDKVRAWVAQSRASGRSGELAIESRGCPQ